MARHTVSILIVLAAGAGLPSLAAMPPVPVPAENPITEEKRILGKLLFWDEQLSSDGTMACGTCHQAAAGGADPAVGLNPGPDGNAGTADDILGSPGVVLADINGNPIGDGVFGEGLQVTGRASMAAVGAAYAPEAFWDGRAGTVFEDPETGTISVVRGGAMENQALGPILSNVEMAHADRTWDDVRRKLQRSAPMDGATDLPDDIRDAIEQRPSYGDLFAAAFGDSTITAERIGLAIATYERTLIPDETPWDRFTEGDPTALTPAQARGWNAFRNSPCSTCHAPPLFTDNTFRNIGLRPSDEDPGRQDVTQVVADAGRFKVPTLRNVGLKPNHMHNGRIPDVAQAVLWYRPNNPQRFDDNLDPRLPVAIPQQALPDVVDFLTNGLTDPRVAAETFPFDRPALHRGGTARLEFIDADALAWNLTDGAQGYNLYRGDLGELARGSYGQLFERVTAATWSDPSTPAPGEAYFYIKTVIDSTGDERATGTTAGRARLLVP